MVVVPADTSLHVTFDLLPVLTATALGVAAYATGFNRANPDSVNRPQYAFQTPGAQAVIIARRGAGWPSTVLPGSCGSRKSARE